MNKYQRLIESQRYQGTPTHVMIDLFWMTSYLYYHKNESWVSDYAWDVLCYETSKRIKESSEGTFYYLTTPEPGSTTPVESVLVSEDLYVNLQTGTGFDVKNHFYSNWDKYYKEEE